MIKIQYLNEYNAIRSINEKAAKRIDFVKKYGYAIPTTEALNTILEFSPIIEIGAGYGYWAYLLGQLGADIVAFDDFSWFGKTILSEKNFYTQVKKGSYEQLSKYPDRALFICWPPPDEPMGYDCIRNYSGKYFIFIGEDQGGCTGEDSFYNYLNENYKRIKAIKLPQWPDFYDKLVIFEKNY